MRPLRFLRVSLEEGEVAAPQSYGARMGGGGCVVGWAVTGQSGPGPWDQQQPDIARTAHRSAETVRPPVTKQIYSQLLNKVKINSV